MGAEVLPFLGGLTFNVGASESIGNASYSIWCNFIMVQLRAGAVAALAPILLNIFDGAGTVVFIFFIIIVVRICSEVTLLSANRKTRQVKVLGNYAR
jgi:hypothetical protein